MSYLTLDEIILACQKLKESGVPGTTLGAIPSTDNNGRGCFMKLIEGVHIATVAKSDIDKRYPICKAVANRGVPVALIS